MKNLTKVWILTKHTAASRAVGSFLVHRSCNVHDSMTNGWVFSDNATMTTLKTKWVTNKRT